VGEAPVRGLQAAPPGTAVVVRLLGREEQAGPVRAQAERQVLGRRVPADREARVAAPRVPVVEAPERAEERVAPVVAARPAETVPARAAVRRATR